MAVVDSSERSGFGSRDSAVAPAAHRDDGSHPPRGRHLARRHRGSEEHMHADGSGGEHEAVGGVTGAEAALRELSAIMGGEL